MFLRNLPILSSKYTVLRLFATVSMILCLCSVSVLASSTTTIPELNLTITLDEAYRIYAKDQQEDKTQNDFFTDNESLYFVAESEEIMIYIHHMLSSDLIDLTSLTDTEIENLMDEGGYASILTEGFSTLIDKNVRTCNGQKYFMCYGIVPNPTTSTYMFEQVCFTVNNNQQIMFILFHFHPSEASIEKSYEIFDSITLLDVVSPSDSLVIEKSPDSGIRFVQGTFLGVLAISFLLVITFTVKAMSNRKNKEVSSDLPETRL